MISLFGIGYVGTVTAACMASGDRRVICVDVDPVKVDMLNRGASPVIEPLVDDLVRDQVALGNLRATTDVGDAVMASTVSMICVGTPGDRSGRPVLDAVMAVARDIGHVLRERGGFHVICIRSTVLPGTVEQVAEVVAEASGKVLGEGFGVASNPEFLREGTAVADYRDPPFTVIGATCARTMDTIAEIYSDLGSPLFMLKTREAELLKYVCNSFHALKVAFANEVGVLARSLDIDGRRVMDVFTRDTALNISPAYLRPGMPYGGSCLPKDTRALSYEAAHQCIELPVIQSIDRSNREHVRRIVERIRAYGRRTIGLFGLTFKAGTDDLRESPLVLIVAELLAAGYDVKIYDPEVVPERLLGANRGFVAEHLPNLTSLLEPSAENLITGADVVVISKRTMGLAPALRHLRTEQHVLDLVGLDFEHMPLHDATRYEGIAW